MNWCSLPCRMWSKVDRSDPAGCWPWTAKARASYGYGLLNVSGTLVRAHRVAYEATHGPIPDGMEVCHRCDNPACCNPAHLFVGTHADNMRDMRAKGRSTMTPEGRARLIASKVGKPRSPEVREKLRLASIAAHERKRATLGL